MNKETNKETNLCMSCITMKPAEPGAKPPDECPHCGWTDNGVHLASYLYPKTFLAKRYIVGKLISYNGEAALYAGYDTLTELRITVKEYMPDALCTRTRDVLPLAVNTGELPLYKTYMAEFVELNRSLQSLSSSRGIQRVTDVFTENGTSYAVHEYIPGTNFKTYLHNVGGTIDYRRLKELFYPVFTALGRANAAGIIHRGISPKTVYINEHSQIYLADFSITAARIHGSNINEEVFAGYAAPEQYNSLEQHGVWTDVYGLAALLYNALTGTDPLDAPERLINDTLTEPVLLNSSIPESISKAIMQAMDLSAENRFKNVEELFTALFGKPVRSGGIESSRTLTSLPASMIRNTGDSFAGFNPDADIDFDDDNSSKYTDINEDLVEAVEKTLRKEAWEKKKKTQRIVIICAISAIVMLFLILIILAVNGVFDTASSSETAAPSRTTEPVRYTTTPNDDEIEVPEGEVAVANYVGNTYTQEWADDLSRREDLDLVIVFEPVYSDEHPQNRVFEQSIERGEVVAVGSELVLRYSLGREFIRLPEPGGNNVNEYRGLLVAAGVAWSNAVIEDKEVEDFTEDMADSIAGINFTANDNVRITGFPGDPTRQADRVIIYRAVAPAGQTTTAVTTTEPVTTATEPVTTTTEEITTAATTSVTTWTTTTPATTTTPMTAATTTEKTGVPRTEPPELYE
jgi:serine/threonine-protein kinase